MKLLYVLQTLLLSALSHQKQKCRVVWDNKAPGYFQVHCSKWQYNYGAKGISCVIQELFSPNRLK